MVEPIIYVLAVLGGFLAGMMNALAGFGSVITLAILMELFGLPPNVANGTNRVNILAMASSSAFMYHKKGHLDLKRGRWILLVMLLGAIIGVYIAISISNEQFKQVFKYILLVLFVLLILNPKQMLKEISEPNYVIPWYLLILVFFPLGIYIGFIQIGGGLIFLLAATIIGKYNLLEGNAIKLTIVAFQTLIVVCIFHLNGLVDWKIGAVVAVGQVAGGLLTVNYATKWPQANKLAYWVLVIIVIAMILKNFLF